MERRIQEDPNIADPALRGFIAITIFIMLLAFSLAARSMHSWTPLLEGLGFTAVLLVFCTVVIRSVHRDRAQPASSWMLTDAGLQRVYESGERETIRWEQVRHMKWVRRFGLILRWEESDAERHHRGSAFKEEFKWDWFYRQYRTTLNVQKAEAEELKSAMRDKTSAAQSRDAQATKSLSE